MRKVLKIFGYVIGGLAVTLSLALTIQYVQLPWFLGTLVFGLLLLHGHMIKRLLFKHDLLMRTVAEINKEFDSRVKSLEAQKIVDSRRLRQLEGQGL